MTEKTLKEIYLSKKLIEEKKKIVEAYHNLNEQFIIMEAIDMNQLRQMASSFERLEGLVQNIPDKDKKVPSLVAALQGSTQEMEKFVNDANAGGLDPAAWAKTYARTKFNNPFTKSATLFSVLSRFFNQEVPAILKAFRANKNPEVPLKQLENADALAKAFTKALTPGGVLGLLGLKQVPYIGNNLANLSNELLNLTYQDLITVVNGAVSIKVPISGEDMKAATQAIAAGKPPMAPTEPASQTAQATQAQQQAAPAAPQKGGTPLKKMEAGEVQDRIRKAGIPDNLQAQATKLLSDLGIQIV